MRIGPKRRVADQQVARRHERVHQPNLGQIVRPHRRGDNLAEHSRVHIEQRLHSSLIGFQNILTSDSHRSNVPQCSKMFRFLRWNSTQFNILWADEWNVFDKKWIFIIILLTNECGSPGRH